MKHKRNINPRKIPLRRLAEDKPQLSNLMSEALRKVDQMAKDIPDQVRISMKMTTEDAEQLMRLILMAQGRAIVAVSTPLQKVESLQRLVVHLADELTRAGRMDVLNRAFSNW